MVRTVDQTTQLRRRFIIMATGASLIALALICLAINIWNWHATCARADALIQVLYENDGVPQPNAQPRPMPSDGFQITAETPYETRYYVAIFDGEGTLATLDTEHIATRDAGEAAATARAIWQGDQTRGFVDYYRFGVFQKDGETCVIVLDCFGEITAWSTFRTSSLAVCGICILIIFLLLIPLSQRVIAPFAENLRRQQRFVTDASHELKTPIAIIMANNDLTESLGGPTPWTESTRNQAERLSRLVKDLVELARADEPLADEAHARVSFSPIVHAAAEDFARVAAAQGKRLDHTVTDDLAVEGSSAELERLVAILLDNAVKYSTDDGTISVALTKARTGGTRCARLTVANPCTNLSAEDMPRIFDRFYRADASRSRETGGYGIGLALAQSIARKHGGALKATLENGAVCFTATLPLA